MNKHFLEGFEKHASLKTLLSKAKNVFTKGNTKDRVRELALKLDESRAYNQTRYYTGQGTRNEALYNRLTNKRINQEDALSRKFLGYPKKTHYYMHTKDGKTIHKESK